jgi:hypothetical protein
MTDLLSPWRDKDPLSLQEVAYLWVGIPPNLFRRTFRDKYPEKMAGAQEIERRIRGKAEAGELKYDRPVETIRFTKQIPSDSRFDEWGRRDQRSRNVETDVTGPVSWDQATFSRAVLKEFADSIGQRPEFLFPEAVSVAALRCLDRTHPHNSKELEAAVLAWQYASERADGSKKKPRQLIEEYLSQNGWGVTAIKRIAPIATWSSKPGPKSLK